MCVFCLISFSQCCAIASKWSDCLWRQNLLTSMLVAKINKKASGDAIKFDRIGSTPIIITRRTCIVCTTKFPTMLINRIFIWSIMQLHCLELNSICILAFVWRKSQVCFKGKIQAFYHQLWHMFSTRHMSTYHHCGRYIRHVWMAIRFDLRWNLSQLRSM